MENILCEALNRKAKIEEIKRIIENNPNICQIKDEEGNLPIHDALRTRAHFDIVKLLVKACPESLLCEDRLGFVPLNRAIVFRRGDEVILYLLHSCPEVCRRPVQSTLSSGFHNRYCLRISLENGCSYDVFYAILSVYPEAVNIEGDGSLPLHIAIQYNSNILIIYHLLELNPKICERKDRLGNFPLHLLCASENENMDLFYRIVSIYPQACEIGNDNKMLPLHRQCQNRFKINFKTIKFLIQTYPKACSMEDDRGYLPIHCFIDNRVHSPISVDDELWIIYFLIRPISRDDMILSRISDRLLAFSLEERNRYFGKDRIERFDINNLVQRWIYNQFSSYLSDGDNKKYISSYHNLNWNARRVFFRILLSSLVNNDSNERFMLFDQNVPLSAMTTSTSSTTSSSSSSSSTHTQPLIHILLKLKSFYSKSSFSSSGNDNSSNTNTSTNSNQNSFPSIFHSDMIRTIILFL